MRVKISAVGRLRSGPEHTLVDDYLNRFGKTGRSLSLGPATVQEVEDRKGGGMAAEAKLLRQTIPDGAVICCLDERGLVETSPAFATRMARWRDDGISDVAFIIGGADGIDPGLRDSANHLLSFGKMVWPHMLVRIMLAEQLYRTATILAGTPYHRT